MQLDVLLTQNIDLKKQLNEKLVEIGNANNTINELCSCLENLQVTSKAAIEELIIQRDQLQVHLKDVTDKAMEASIVYNELIEKKSK